MAILPGSPLHGPLKDVHGEMMATHHAVAILPEGHQQCLGRKAAFSAIDDAAVGGGPK
jgi:hypothetical protein